MSNDKENIIVEKTFDLEIIDYSEKLRDLKKFEMNSQLFRSGTSVGANSWKPKMRRVPQISFINLKSRLKKPDETNYWIKLYKASKHCQIHQKHYFQN